MIELVISLGLSAALMVGFIYGIKRFSAVHKVELVRTELFKLHKNSLSILGSDLAAALRIEGSTSALYSAVSRPPADPLNPTVFSNSENNDDILIYKELHPEISGFVYKIEKVSGTTNRFNIYYQLDNTVRDSYFSSAIQHKKYFFISNKDHRNIIENLYGRGGDGCGTVGVGVPPVPQVCKVGSSAQCYVFRAGYCTSLTSDVLDLDETKGTMTALKVGEKVLYSVSSAGVLERTIDDSTENKKGIIENVKDFRATYTFDSAMAVVEGRAMPTSSLRSVYDGAYSSYLSLLPSSPPLSRITYHEILDMKVVMTQNYLEHLSEVRLSAEGSSGLEVDDSGHITFASHAIYIPGREYNLTKMVDSGRSLNPVCTVEATKKCNPACTSLFTSSDPKSNDWIEYGNLSSDICICGKDTTDGKFYDPYLHPEKIPYFNASIRGAYGGTQPVDPGRANACARHTKCGEEHKLDTMDYRHPGCLLARACLRTEVQASVLNTTPNAGAADYFILSSLQSSVLAGVTPFLTTTQPQLNCHYNNWRVTCDQAYAWIQNSNTFGNTWNNACGCQVNTIVNLSAPSGAFSSLPLENQDSDSLCHLPNSPAALAGRVCTNTMSPGLDGVYGTGGDDFWRLKDDQNNQGLSELQAKLCACRLNNALNAVTSPPFGAGIPSNDRPFANQWWWKDWEMRWANFFFDFRAAAAPSSPAAGVNPLFDPTVSPAISDAINMTGQPSQCGDFRGYNTGNLNPRCGSSRSQMVPNTIVGQWNSSLPTPGFELNPVTNVNCGMVQKNLTDTIVPGACLQTSWPPGAVPNGFPIAIIGPTAPLWLYRFFCDNRCGIGSGVNQFNVERDFIRNLIKTAAGAPANASWCSVSGGGGGNGSGGDDPASFGGD